MVLSVQSDAMISEELEFTTDHPLLPSTPIEHEGHEFERKQRLRPTPSIDRGSEFSLGNLPFELEDHPNKIECFGFSINNPWLPAKTLKLLNKLKKTLIAERELVNLMEQIARRASVHFELTKGKFVAMTFLGRVVEVSDTRVGLLKKIQGQKYREQIFVWRIGSKAFSGRI